MMKVKALLLGLVAAAVFAGTSQAGEIPINVSGFNENMVVGVGQSYSDVTASMDDGAPATGGNTWYAVGQNVGAPTTGLPMGTVQTSAADGTTQFSFQPSYTNNALLIDGSHSGTLTLDTPAKYTTLSLFGSTGNGNNTLNYTLNFADGSTASGTAFFHDWFGGSNVAYDANGRINGGGYDNVNAGNPNVYQVDLGSIASSSALKSIDFSLANGGGHTAIFAVSGTALPTPEPASLSLLGLGGLGLVLARRRRLA